VKCVYLHLNFVYVYQVLMLIGLIYHQYQNYQIKFINLNRVSVILARLIHNILYHDYYYYNPVYSFGSWFLFFCLYIV